jgi:hypothetical protein
MSADKAKEMDARVARLESAVKALKAINRCWYYSELVRAQKELAEICRINQPKEYENL